MDGASDVMTHHGKRVVAKKINSGYPLQYVSNRRPVTEEEKENALKIADAASTPDTPDSFIAVLRATHVYRRFFMSIPSGWAFSHLLHKNQDVILHVKEKENIWHASYYGRVGVNSGGLVGGWKDFAVENNFEEFDVCLFEIARETHDEIVMDVSIFRVVAEVSALTQVSRFPSKRGRPSKYRRKSDAVRLEEEYHLTHSKHFY